MDHARLLGVLPAYGLHALDETRASVLLIVYWLGSFVDVGVSCVE